MNNLFLLSLALLLLVIQRYFTLSHLKRQENSIVLKDKGFDLLPHIHSPVYTHLIDVLLYSFLVLVSLRLDTKQTNLFLLSILYIFSIRFVCLYVTRLPHSGSTCKNSHSALIQSNECTTDYIFSGHTSLFLLSLLHLREVYPTYAVPFLALFTVFVYLIVATRSHYTVDVVLAIVVTYCIYVIVGIKHNKLIV